MKNFKERISQVPFNVPIEDPWLLDVFQCIPHFRNQIVTYYKVPSSKSYVVHAEMNGTRFLFSTILALKLFWGYRVENVPLQEVKPTIDETETEFRRRIN